MSENKVYFGLERVHIAPVSDDWTDESPKWDAPIHVPGAVSFQPSAKTQSSNFYADNMEYYTSYSNNGESGSLEQAKLPDEVYRKIYNWIEDDNGGLLAVTDEEPKKFALMFEVGGSPRKIRIVYYMCTGSPPTQQYGTTTATKDVKTTTISVDAAPIRLPNGKTAAKYIMREPKPGESNPAWDNFFNEVALPSISGGGSPSDD